MNSISHGSKEFQEITGRERPAESVREMTKVYDIQGKLI